MNDLVRVVENEGRQTIDPGQNFQGMTVKEIAELCGVDQSTVWRWAQGNDLLQNAKGIAEKLEDARKSGKDPAKFTLEETLAIIGEGGGNKTLASLLADNVAIKKVWNSPEMVIRKAIQLTEDCIEDASEHARAGLKAKYTLWIESKGMKYLENPGKKCAWAIRQLASAFKEVLDDNSVLYMHCLDAHQKLFRTCARLGISPNEVPTWKSWEEEWPNFLELCVPERLMGYRYPDNIAELCQERQPNSSRELEDANE
jgi:transcriptional regulator with XRE-family HTH domain